MKYNDRINSGIKSKRFTAMTAATVESNIDNSLIRSNDNNNPYYNLENLYEEDSKIVLDTIRMPKKLKLLKGKDSLKHKNYKSIEIEKINPVEKIMKTLKLKILNRDKYIFESQKGNIDMIIEE